MAEEKTVTETPEETSLMTSFIDDDGGREAYYRSTQKEEAKETEASTEKEETGEEEQIKEPGEEELEEKYVPEEKSEPDKSEESEKTVPLAALHEEREKRKGLSREVADLKKKVSELLDDNERLLNVVREPPAEGDDFTDPKVRDLEKQIKDLLKFKENVEKTSEQSKMEKLQSEHKRNLKKANEELADEGFPGFEFAVGKVANELQAMVADDPESIYLDNVEGWKKIYKERVFPKLKTIFVGKQKKDADEDKVDLKKKAKLAASPGKSGEPAKGKENMTTDERYAAYLEARRKSGIS